MAIIPYAYKDIENCDAAWHHRVTIRFLVCITCDALHTHAPVYCMYMYNVQISHTSLVFVSECSTQSHTAVWFLLLQVALQQQLDRAS